MFLPMTVEELRRLGWKKLDVILVTGDAYIDSYHSGVALIGKLLLSKGYKVGVISQPDVNSERDISALGEPGLFWGVSAGCVDSIVANYTPLRKKRKSDDFTPGGKNTKRPDRATIVYTNLIRRYFKNTVPIILGGIEASLRRITHYDFLDDDLRKPILFDSKADILVYGMGEVAILEIAEKLKNGLDYRDTRGICFLDREKEKYLKKGYIELPSFEEAKNDKLKFIEMFKLFYENNDPLTARGLIQKTMDRYLIQNPPARLLSKEEMDFIYGLSFERDVHPAIKSKGEVKAIHTIQFSIITHRGCYGECNFCSISVHQGRHIVERSEHSVIEEAKRLVKHKGFKGYITDVGGPTANMYGIECEKKKKTGACKDKRCLFPTICKNLNLNHSRQLNLLKKLSEIEGIKGVFIGSGIRPDLVIEDKLYRERYLEEIVTNHTGGQLKIAPEHADERVLKLMGKMGVYYTEEFKRFFDKIIRKTKSRKFLTYYFIAAHPGCEKKDMLFLKNFIREKLKLTPEQVQIFTPTPSTFSSLMYYTELNPFTFEKIFVEKNLKDKEKQKEIIVRD
ncbi:MAG: YgiQ family radical SAM protein [Brevinematia bacterium]